MQAEPLINWHEPVVEYIGFVAQFLALGAIGFRFAAVRDRLHSSGEGGAVELSVYQRAVRRGAVIGLIALLVQVALFAQGLPRGAARAHLSVSAFVTSNLPVGAQCVLFAAAVIGFAMAAAGRRAGWLLSLGAVLAPLTPLLRGQIAQLVNPVHRLVAGLWLGTLFVLVVCGLATVLRDEPSRARRGAMAADMVNGFSPLALVCGAIVVISGLITAFKHLDPFSSLWTTPYGYALIAKLAAVAVVFGLGAFNWRRMRPTLGSDAAAGAIRRSATAELTAAAIVLAITAVLVSLPSPRAHRGPPPGATPTAPTGAPPAGG